MQNTEQQDAYLADLIHKRDIAPEEPSKQLWYRGTKAFWQKRIDLYQQKINAARAEDEKRAIVARRMIVTATLAQLPDRNDPSFEVYWRDRLHLSKSQFDKLLEILGPCFKLSWTVVFPGFADQAFSAWFNSVKDLLSSSKACKDFEYRMDWQLLDFANRVRQTRGAGEQPCLWTLKHYDAYDRKRSMIRNGKKIVSAKKRKADEALVAEVESAMTNEAEAEAPEETKDEKDGPVVFEPSSKRHKLDDYSNYPMHPLCENAEWFWSVAIPESQPKVIFTLPRRDPESGHLPNYSTWSGPEKDGIDYNTFWAAKLNLDRRQFAQLKRAVGPLWNFNWLWFLPGDDDPEFAKWFAVKQTRDLECIGKMPRRIDHQIFNFRTVWRKTTGCLAMAMDRPVWDGYREYNRFMDPETLQIVDDDEATDDEVSADDDDDNMGNDTVEEKIPSPLPPSPVFGASAMPLLPPPSAALGSPVLGSRVMIAPVNHDLIDLTLDDD